MTNTEYILMPMYLVINNVNYKNFAQVTWIKTDCVNHNSEFKIVASSAIKIS